jgi:hypothetical protein
MKPRSIPVQLVRATEDYHRYEWYEANLLVELERFLEGREGGLSCEVLVSVGGIRLYRGRLNLLSAQSKGSLARALAARMANEDWAGMLEAIADESIERWRRGEPLINLDDVEPQQGFNWLVEPFLEVGQPTVLFSDGGEGKSTLALAIAISIASGHSICGLPYTCGPVLYLDWEDRPETLRIRRDAILRGHGVKLEHPIYYKRMTASLPNAAKEIAKVVKERQIVKICVDSLGMARGGDPNDAAETIPLFTAMRSINTSPLGLDHVSKAGAEAENPNPYGSIYTRDIVRQLWFLKRVQEPGATVATLLLKSRKVNHMGRLENLAFRLYYENKDSALQNLRFEPVEPRDLPELMDQLSLEDRILASLREGAMTPQELAETINAPGSSVRPRLLRLEAAGKIVRLEKHRWGLRAQS